MATVGYTSSPVNAATTGAGIKGAGVKVTWSNLTENDTATAWDGGFMYPDKSIQIEGIHGTTVIQGSNDETNYVTLNDIFDTALSFTADSLRQIAENPRLIRPSVSSGTGVSVNITILAVRRN